LQFQQLAADRRGHQWFVGDRGLIAQRSVNLSARALDRTPRRVERIPDLLPCIVEVTAGAFGWTFLLAGRQAQGEQCHYWQQFPHGAVSLCWIASGLNPAAARGFHRPS
jgi:hypothetical protein